jgi:hypothetical protein
MKIHKKFELNRIGFENKENGKKNEKEKDKNLTWALNLEFGPTYLSHRAAHQPGGGKRRHLGPHPSFTVCARVLLLSVTPTDAWARFVRFFSQRHPRAWRARR